MVPSEMSMSFSFRLRACAAGKRKGPEREEREGRARLFCVDGRVDRALDERGDDADKDRERLCAMVSAQQRCVLSSYAQI
jgi:hypothetical protein